MHRATALLLIALVGCDAAPAGPGAPAPDRFPYPGPFWMQDGHVALGEALPYATTPVPGERVAWRVGFSPVQSAVIPVEVDLDTTSLSGPDGVGTGGTVQLWDLTDGRELPCFAEVDAWPDPDGARPLLVRPGAPMPFGHTVAVVVTSRVKRVDGAPFSAPAWYADAVDGRPGAGLEPYAADLKATADALAGLGVADVAMAFAFPVADGTAPLTSVLEQVPVPTAWDLSAAEQAGGAAELPARVWKRIEGSLTVDSWLVNDGRFELDEQGLPIRQGTAEALLYVHFPESVRDAEPGTVPVWLFGHGIFGEPQRYLEDEDDASAVIELADRAGAIVVATKWRGLTTSDALVAATVGTDFGRLPELTDKLVQGVANTYALTRAVLEGDLLDDPAFAGLPAKGELSYYGISLGGIEGAVLLANQSAIGHGVFHVGGSTWSTMLERSSNWTAFEDFVVVSGLDRMEDRQILYAVSQLFWDPADPGSYAGQLQGRSVLWQESIGDDQVPNLTTEILARGAGARLLTPQVTTPWGLDTVAPPTTGPALAQFDPDITPPPPTNRPAPDTAAHETPRLWEGAKAQTLRFLDGQDPGVVEHFCGEAACTSTNTGDL